MGTPSPLVSNRELIPTQLTQLFAQIVRASREPSPVLLGMKSALWTTIPPAALAGESEVPTVLVLTLVLMPTPNCTPTPWLELTLRQELTPTRSPTTPLSSPTRLILSQQPFQAMPSKLCNKTVLNSP